MIPHFIKYLQHSYTEIIKQKNRSSLNREFEFHTIQSGDGIQIKSKLSSISKLYVFPIVPGMRKLKSYSWSNCDIIEVGGVASWNRFGTVRYNLYPSEYYIRLFKPVNFLDNLLMRGLRFKNSFTPMTINSVLHFFFYTYSLYN